MKKFVTLLLISICSLSYGQDSPIPKPQPLDETTETPLKAEVVVPSIEGVVNTLGAGGIYAGQQTALSPEIGFLNRFQDIPVNLYTGIPQISFPIYTLNEPGNVSIPVVLQYNASGMKAHDVAGWVGMNWALVAGGQVTRIVRGIPDEGKYSLDNQYFKTERKGFYQHGVFADGNLENDSQPDLFMLNINGASYKFSFDQNKKAHFYPEADINVEVEWLNLSSNNIVGAFVNWKFTMSDGVQYYFYGGLENEESSFEIETNEAITILGETNHKFGNYEDAQGVVSAWYLNKIETSFGAAVNFDYHRTTGYSFFKLSDQSTTTANCNFTAIDKKINKVFVRSSALYKISNATKVVEFNQGGWEEVSGGWVINNTYPARTDIDRFSRYPSSSSNARALHKITVYAKDDPNTKLNWNLNYSYNNGYDQGGVPPFGYNYSQTGTTHLNRYKLSGIQDPAGNSVTFSYYDDGFALPSRFTMGVDHWGYLNGANGATHLIGRDFLRNCTTGFSNRTATLGWSKYGTISNITYSTGLNTALDYESHTASNFNETVGGVRIRKITNTDIISGLKTTKTYEYSQENSTTSSGMMYLKPVYVFDDENQITPRNQYWYSGLYEMLLGESGRPVVGYTRVKEKILSNNESSDIGYTIHEFLQPGSPINLSQTIVTNCRTVFPPEVPYPTYVCDTVGVYTRPWKWNPYQENTTGIPKRTLVYNASNQLLSEQFVDYQESILRATVNSQTNYRSFRLMDKNYNFKNSYTESFGTYRPISETSKIYSTNGTNPITTTTQYFYDESPIAKHNQLSKTITTDAQGHSIIQEMKYAPDFEFGPNATLGGDAPGIKSLQDKHIWNVPILTTTKKIALGETFTTGASYLNFYNDNTADHKAGMANSSYGAIDLPNLYFSPFDQTGNTIIPSGSFELKSKVSKYTAIGLPVESNANYGPTSTVNYHPTYTNLVTNSTSNVGQPSAQTGSISYNKILFGSTVTTAPNGLQTTSEHYPDGQLKQVKDHNGHIVKHVQYVYRNQADTDPYVNTSTAYNRVITRMPRVATTNALGLDHTQCQIAIQYLDGSGRVLQSVAYKASPSQKDLVSGLTEYDEYSRPINSWPTVESDNTDGSYYADILYKAKARAFYNDQNPYTAIKTYEASPLSRVFESYDQGADTQNNNRFAQANYQTISGIVKFTLPYNSNTVTVGNYTTVEIIKSSRTDEKGETLEEYKDKTGKLLLKTVAGLTTAYIYDTADRLRYTLTPKGYYNILAESYIQNMEAWAHFGGQVYAYVYDTRGRMTRKHSPGTGWQSIVYNRMGQALLSQDAHEAESNLWNFTKYDGLGRSIQTGQLTYAQNRSQIQADFDNYNEASQFEERNGNLKGYTNRSFFANLANIVTEQSLKTVAYFDNYSWAGALPYTGYPYTATMNSNATGMATGSLIKIDGQSDTFYPATQYYDTKNRLIQSRNTHELGGTNQSDIAQNFAGEATQSQNVYRRSGAADIIIKKENKLDHIGRTIDQYYEIVPTLARFVMSSYSYDNVGRIATKKIQPYLGSQASQNSTDWNNPATWNSNRVPSLNTATQVNHTVTLQSGASAGSGTLTLGTNGVLILGTNSTLTIANTNASRPALQSINYSYTVKNQLLGINHDANGNPATSNEALFSYKLGYDYDGNITSNTWRTALDHQNRSFTYGYDAAKRLTMANYTGIGAENYTTSQVYDANGNIETLSRNSKVGANYGVVDQLAYSYMPANNRLQKVDDFAPNVGVFADAPGNNDYQYYPDGKLRSDANKGITAIEYNYLDLVKKITLSTGQIVEYEYTATGERRKKKVTGGGQNQYNIYDGEIQYTSTNGTNYSIAEIKNSEGRYTDSGLEYGYTDQLGNLRLSYKAGASGAEVTQAQNYDPWGNVLEGSQYINTTNTDNYLITGKEYQRETGYTSLDWREYDSVLGRMHVPDPIDHTGINAYNYCANNPVINIDPDGQSFMAILAVSLFSGHIGGMLSLNRGGSYGSGFGRSFATSAVGGAVGAFAPIGFLPGAAYGAGAGVLSNGIGNAVSGQNFWQGAGQAALFGGIGGGVSGGVGALKNGGDFWTGAVPDHVMLATPENIIKGVTPVEYDAESVSEIYQTSFSDVGLKGNFYTNKGGGKAYHEDTNGVFQTNKGPALAVTKARRWSNGKVNDIYFGKASFTSKEQLAYVLTHELAHSVHNMAGLWALADTEYFNNLSGIKDSQGHIAIGMVEHEFIQINNWSRIVNYHSEWTREYMNGYGNSRLYDPIKFLVRKIK